MSKVKSQQQSQQQNQQQNQNLHDQIKAVEEAISKLAAEVQAAKQGHSELAVAIANLGEVIPNDQAAVLYKKGRPWYDHPLTQAGAHVVSIATAVGTSLLLTKKFLLGE